jgi:hypothetical protein
MQAETAEEIEMSNVRPLQTCDGKRVSKGDRVFNYYDVQWGVIASDPDRDGWFNFRADGETKTRMLNGERISTVQPEWLK